MHSVKALGTHPPRAVALPDQGARVAPTQAMKCNLLTSARARQVTGEPAWVATVVFPTNPLFYQSFSGYRNGSVCCFSKIFMPLGRSGLGGASRRPVDGVPLASSAGYRRRSAIRICFPRLSLTTQNQPDISASQWNTSPSLVNSRMLWIEIALSRLDTADETVQNIQTNLGGCHSGSWCHFLVYQRSGSGPGWTRREL
jgi:hypothetical protein